MKVTFFQKSVVSTFSLDRLADSLQVTTWHRHYFYRMLPWLPYVENSTSPQIYPKSRVPTNARHLDLEPKIQNITNTNCIHFLFIQWK